MKAFIVLFFALSIIPVSIFTMIYGWGLTPSNWGWVAFGYTWMIIPSIVQAMVSRLNG